MSPRLLDAGDAAFTLEFGDTIDPALLAAVRALDAAVARAQAAGRLPGLIETMPTFRSLTLFFDPLVTGRQALLDALQPLLAAMQPRLDTAAHAPPAEGRLWRLPVCYEGDAAPDLADTARVLGISADALVALHSGTELRVYMLGFLPGLPFMGDLPAALHLPRRSEPRLRVPAGSVAIAGGLSAIYPWQSPGGWHLIGRCPVRLFDATRAAPSLLAVGDRVQFDPVSLDTCRVLEDAAQAGTAEPMRWLQQGAEPAAQGARR